MPILRNTIRSSARERTRRIDRTFERIAQVLLIANLLFVLASWLSYREAIRITEVAVTGTLAVEAEAVKRTAESLLARPLLWKIDRNNALLYPKRAIGKAVKHLDARVKTVDLRIIERKRMVVTVGEYVPALLWCSPDQFSATTTVTRGCYFADADGHIFARAPEYSGNPFLVFATTYPLIRDDVFLDNFSVLPKEEFDRVNAFLSQLGTLGLTPRIVSEAGADDFVITIDEPWTIRWSLAGDPEADGANLALVLKELGSDPVAVERLESIDLRFGNKVFYR
ncbi:MAG: hypothetical protein Q7S52_02860 [bacterium]|nr:hypothetical protein [bacterium]